MVAVANTIRDNQITVTEGIHQTEINGNLYVLSP
jgi:hypothetical protein